MVKKRKRKPSEFMEKSVKREIKQMKEGEFVLDKQHKIRYKKTRIPKWLDKYDVYGKSSHINFRQKSGRWMNNEERIVIEIHSYFDHKIMDLSKKSKIDYKNISRYLKALEKKDLIKIEGDFRFKRMKSGKLKRVNLKTVRLTEKGIKKKKDYLGY